MRRPGLVLSLAFALAAGVSGPAKPSAAEDTALAAPRLTPQRSGTHQRLQAISPIDEQIAWASGVGGTYAVTTDGGEHWRAGVVPGAEKLEFRDVHAISAQRAYLLAAGRGESSRIYYTEDGGKTWALQFTNTEERAFYDCFAFWTAQRGLAMSDGVSGVFPVLRTRDGKSWEHLGERAPRAQVGEGGFAASGTCVTTHGDAQAWIATGAGPEARVLATRDGGESWTAHATPVTQGSATSGIFTIAFRDAQHGFLGAGNLEDETGFGDHTAASSDGGKSWSLRARAPFPGAIYGSSYVPGGRPLLVITGPRGAAWSTDDGATWNALQAVAGFWAVAFASPQAGWMVGIEGRILKVAF